MTKIRVISVDYDDCLVPKDFAGNIAQINQKLIANLRQKPYATTIGLIGSNRQSVRDDQRNQNNNNNLSCYQQIPLFYQQIDVAFDSFLLPDAYNQLPSGTTFDQAITTELKSSYGCPHDLSKISLLYAQMQKIANEHPDIDIDFEFYDDKEHIINDLQQFFAKNRQLIPENINLTLIQYIHNAPQDKPIANTRNVLEAQVTLIGSGPINPYYQHSLNKLGNQVLTDLQQRGALYDVDGHEVTSEVIRQSYYNGNYQFNGQHYEPLLIALANPQLLELQLAVAQITKDYIVNNNNSSMFSWFHFHGESGTLRAEQFLSQVNAIDDPERLKRAINEFIMESKNGNTHPHSYRTMLFHHFYEHGGNEFSLHDASKMLSAHTQPLSCWGSSSDKDADGTVALFTKS